MQKRAVLRVSAAVLVIGIVAAGGWFYWRRDRPTPTGLAALHAPAGFTVQQVAGSVGLEFTPSGETIGTMTYFKDLENGERDALLHFVEGGVYPKWYAQVMGEFRLTGDLMPVMTKFARIAPAGLVRYRGTAFGTGYGTSLFTAQFNPHRVQRHVVHRAGASFRTEDSDFLTSSDPDFHPRFAIALSNFLCRLAPPPLRL